MVVFDFVELDVCVCVFIYNNFLFVYLIIKIIYGFLFKRKICVLKVSVKAWKKIIL